MRVAARAGSRDAVHIRLTSLPTGGDPIRPPPEGDRKLPADPESVRRSSPAARLPQRTCCLIRGNPSATRPMNPTATDREQVLATLRAANELFSRRATGASVGELNHLQPETAAALSSHLAEAWNWVHTDGRDEEADEIAGDG